ERDHGDRAGQDLVDGLPGRPVAGAVDPVLKPVAVGQPGPRLRGKRAHKSALESGPALDPPSEPRSADHPRRGIHHVLPSMIGRERPYLALRCVGPPKPLYDGTRNFPAGTWPFTCRAAVRA